MQSNSEISQRYAKALYELSLESKSLKNIEKDVLNLKSMIIKNSNLNELIKSHVISRENKAKVIEKILKKLKSHSLIVKFMGTIALNGRMNFIEDIIDQFLNKLSIERGEIRAELITAIPISKEIKNLLEDKAYLDNILLEGVEKANEIASKKIKKIKEIVGF